MLTHKQQTTINNARRTTINNAPRATKGRKVFIMENTKKRGLCCTKEEFFEYMHKKQGKIERDIERDIERAAYVAYVADNAANNEDFSICGSLI